MPYLEIKLGPDTMLLRFVGRIDYVFGRLPRADVQLRDMKVSRLHTQVFIDSRGNAFMRDLGSSGGTWINNQRLRQDVIAPLTDGLRFRIGDARLTYYDADPPVNAIEPPGHSAPRGLIRANARQRAFEAEATVLAVDKVSPDTRNGPAEPPPEIDPAQFADGPVEAAQPPKPPARVPGGKHNTGIVEAPWEKPSAPEPGREKRISIQPPVIAERPISRPAEAAPPALMPSARIDDIAEVAAPVPEVPPLAPRPVSPLPPKPVSPLPPRRLLQETDALDETGRTSREPAVPDSAAFKAPPPIAGEMPIEDDEPAPRLGLPTVRLERPAILERQKQLEQEEADEAALLKIPTAAVTPGEPPLPEESEPAPMIGAVAPRVDTPVAADAEELDDDQLTEYLGGSVSGGFGEVDFGDGAQAAGDSAEEDAGDEVSFGGAAAMVRLPDDSEIDLMDDEPAEEQAGTPEDAGARTSQLGGTTAVSAEPVEELAGEPIEEAFEEPMDDTGEAADDETSPPRADVPQVPEFGTPLPPSREGATAARAFQPRKTRKLMKRRRETSKITDKKNLTPLPQGAQTVHVPPPGMDQPILPGAKTMFIPKPEDVPQPERPTGKPRAVAENRERRTLEDMAEGPGGDTVAIPPAMLKELQSGLPGKEQEPPTIGENPTVKLAGDEDEEEDFVLDDDYAFFTPPPPTRQAREAAARAGMESEVVDASDFAAGPESVAGDPETPSGDDPEK